MKRLMIATIVLLISSAAMAANVFPTRSADQSRPSKAAALLRANLPTQKAFIAHCDADYDMQGNPILGPDGNQTYTCWYEMDQPPGDSPCSAGFFCDTFNSCSTVHTTPYSGCSYVEGICTECS